jgi:uncharacterized membrane protein
METKPSPAPSFNREALLIYGIIAASFVLRMANLGKHELWLDEANTVMIIQGSLRHLFAGLSADASPPLYYLILHFWTFLFGTTEYALRMPSVLFGVALVIATYRAGKQYFGPRTGLYAAGLSAVTPLTIFYAQQVRMYTLLPLLALLSTYYLIEALEEGKKSSWAGYVIATTLCLYTHNYGLFILPIGVICVVAFKEYRQRLKGFALCLLAIAVLYAPWIPTLLKQNIPERYFWIALHLESVHPVLDIPWSLHTFGIVVQYPWYLYVEFYGGGLRCGSNILLAALSILLYLFLFVSAMAFHRDPSVSSGKVSRCRNIFLLFLFVPLLCAFILSFFQKIYLVGRYDIIVFSRV